MASSSCGSAVQDVFGPVVASTCLDGFDFTLLFEEAVLTLVPLAAFGMSPSCTSALPSPPGINVTHTLMLT